MFGLSIKEKLFKALAVQCAEKLPIFEADMRELVRRGEDMSEDAAAQAYAAAMQRYTDAVAETVLQGLPQSIRLRASLALLQPTITGLPEEYGRDFDFSPYAGKHFAICYYAVTGNRIQLSDYGRYMRPIDQHQAELVNGVLRKLSE